MDLVQDVDEEGAVRLEGLVPVDWDGWCAGGEVEMKSGVPLHVTPFVHVRVPLFVAQLVVGKSFKRSHPSPWQVKMKETDSPLGKIMKELLQSNLVSSMVYDSKRDVVTVSVLVNLTAMLIAS